MPKSIDPDYLRQERASTMKTVIGLFNDLADSLDVIYQLRSNGFARESISFVMNDAAEFYPRYERRITDSSTDLIADLVNTLTKVCSQLIPGVGLAVTAGPLLHNTNAMTAHLLNALKSVGIPEERAEAYTEGVRRGGSLVVVHDGANTVQAVRIINLNNPIDIDRRLAAWHAEGWLHFNSHTAPLSLRELEAERQHARGLRDYVGGIGANGYGFAR